MELQRKYLLHSVHCDSHGDVTIYMDALNRDRARAIAVQSICLLHDCAPDDVSLYNLHNWSDMQRDNISADTDLRPFETGWQGGRVVNWVSQPLFLVSDNREWLMRKWVELQAQLQAQSQLIDTTVRMSFDKLELHELNDAVSHQTERYLKSGDREGHERQYGSVSVLLQLKRKLFQASSGVAVETAPWWGRLAARVAALRVKQGLPEWVGDAERAGWER